MPINRFIADAPAQEKIVRLIGPSGSGVVRAEITCGNRSLSFDEWDAATVAAALTDAEFPEFTDLEFAADGNDVVVTGPEDDDFTIGLTYRPTVTITNDQGVTQVNQQTRLSFSGARGGTYTLTINGLTTAAIDYGDESDLIDQIELLSGWTAGDAAVVSATPDTVILEFKGTLAGTPVAVTMDASNLQNGRDMTIREAQSYRPSPHDVYILALDASTTCSVTIDGSSATIRSDESLATIRQKLQALSTRTLNVYGGPNGVEDGDGITCCHFVLDFAGWDASTRPTVSVTASDGAAQFRILNNPASATGFSGLREAGLGLTLGQCSHWLLDFTQGDTITVEYDGVEVSLTAPDDATVGAISTRAADIQTQLRDASEYDEAVVDYTAVGWSPSTDAYISRYLLHVLNVNDTLVQTGGTGQLVRINYPGSGATGAIHHIHTPAGTASGNFKLTLPEGTTAALSATISSGDLQTALAALVASTTVSGSGTPASPWVVTYPSAVGARDLPIATDVALGGNGIGSAATLRESVRAKNQTARFAIGTNATSGAFSVRFGNEGPVTITLNDSAGTVDAALATLPAIGDASYINTTYNSESQTYDIVFASSLANRKLPLFTLVENNMAVVDVETVEVQQRATGPRNIAEAQNWSLGRLPHAGDTIVFEASVGDAVYGLRQWVKVTANTSTEQLVAAAGHDLRNGQIVRFLTGDTLPTGVSAGTDYYVLDADNEAGTFRVSATATGTAVNLTAAGSGDIFCGVLAAEIRIAASFTDSIGREERNSSDTAEYRPRYLQMGLPSTGLCEIGGGAGRGSSLLRLDLGYSEGTLRVIRTDSTSEVDRPSCCLLMESDVLDVELINGDVGLAAFDEETCTLADLVQQSGALFCGEVSVSSLQKQGGRLLSRNLTVAGSIVMQG